MTGNFVEIPSSVTIEAENGVEMDAAVFRCRHQRIEAGISWLINGSSSRLYRDVMDDFIRESSGTHVDTLTIPAIPEYNGSEVVCEATFFDESLRREVTPPANLILIGMLAYGVLLLDYVLSFLIVTHEATTRPPPPTTMEPCKTGSFRGVLIVVMTVHCACCFTFFIVTREAITQPTPTTTMEPGKTG